MSGMEAVGLVVGILPLLISTTEYYETVTRPFKRYRKFVPELELYQQQLGAQKTIFRNECRLLLTTLTGGHLAKEMLKETKHASWSNIKLDGDLAHQLGDSGQACHNVIEVIKTKLKAIEEEADNFGHAIQQSIPERSIGDKAWRSRVAKKCKFSVAEPRLEKNIQALRKLNQDFVNLAQQTTRLGDCGNKVTDWSNIPLQSERKVQECRIIQRASERLYNALRKACQTHTQHSAHFRLDSQHIDATGQEQSLVRFTMGFAQDQGNSVVAEPVWITIDSMFEEPDSEEKEVSPVQPEACKALTDLSDSLKRELSKPAVASTKRLKTKSVSFVIPPSSSNSNPAIFTTIFNMSLPDFCVKHDLCNQLEKRGTCTPENKYLGFLEKSSSCKHLVYFAPPVSTHSSSKTISLAQMISQVSQKTEGGKFLQYERLRLARKLAAAVLQFHATPVLKDCWRGENIIFFGNVQSIESPHIAVHVGDAYTVSHINITEPAKIIQHVIRNQYLFNLGLILIELAYQAPIKTLHEIEDLENGQESPLTDFFTANRLVKMIDTSMGVPYAKIVRKCLECDFGEGNDLKSPALQVAFYKDVVCELERLERGFAKLQLAE